MMLIVTILQKTPVWVWGILVVLVVLGLLQSAPRTLSVRRILLLPLAMTALSLHGTFNTFPPAAWSWLMWVGAALVTATWFASADLPAGTRFDAQRRLLEIPGSWQPMVLMMAIFFTRYVVGVVLAMAPALTHDPATAAIVSSIYGALSGVFLGRTVRMLRVTRAGLHQPPQEQSVAWG
jgi:hypothetical protein